MPKCGYCQDSRRRFSFAAGAWVTCDQCLPDAESDELGGNTVNEQPLYPVDDMGPFIAREITELRQRVATLEARAYADQALIYDLRTRAEEAEAEVQRLRDEFFEHVGTDVI